MSVACYPVAIFILMVTASSTSRFMALKYGALSSKRSEAHITRSTQLGLDEIVTG